MESISLKVLNEILSEETREEYKVSENKGHQGIHEDDDGRQGEYNERFEYFQHPEMPKNIFLQLTFHTNSYGYDESVKNVKFVEGVAKTITVYE